MMILSVILYRQRASLDPYSCLIIFLQAQPLHPCYCYSSFLLIFFLVARKNVLFRIKQRKNPPLLRARSQCSQSTICLCFMCEKNLGIIIVRRDDPSLVDFPHSLLSHRLRVLKFQCSVTIIVGQSVGLVGLVV